MTENSTDCDTEHGRKSVETRCRECVDMKKQMAATGLTRAGEGGCNDRKIAAHMNAFIKDGVPRTFTLPVVRDGKHGVRAVVKLTADARRSSGVTLEFFK